MKEMIETMRETEGEVNVKVEAYFEKLYYQDKTICRILKIFGFGVY